MRIRLAAGGCAFALALLAGCGSGSGSLASSPTPTPAPTPTATPTPTPTPTPSPTPASVFNTVEYNRSTGPDQHNAIPAWQVGATGRGVAIGIVDSGIDTTNPEFSGRISPLSADVAGSRGMGDDAGHGTMVALVAAAARDSSGIMGIAFDATIMAMRADTPGTCADPTGGCSFNDNEIATGIDRAVQGGAKVINLSLGGSPPNSRLIAAAARAAAAGVVLVVSAGNDANNATSGVDPNNPDPFAAGLRQAGNGNVIIAGSVDAAGAISAFSNRAGSDANWYLMALGDRVCCQYENGQIKVTVTNGRSFNTVYSGTSFSAPQIAGAVALLRQAFPNLTAVQVVDLLLRNANDAGAAGIDPVYGRGILNIGAAFAPQGTLGFSTTQTLLPLGDTTGTASPAMGDAMQLAPLSATMLDSYRRAYSVDLGARLRSASPASKLAPSLLAPMRSVAAGGERVSLAFSVDGRGGLAAMPWTGQLRLGQGDAETARVLAARIAARISPRTSFAFGYAQGAEGIVAQVQGRSEPAFLVAGAPAGDFGFARSGETSLALRRQLGGLGLTLSAERGQAIEGAALPLTQATGRNRRRAGISRFGLTLDRRRGDLDAALGASWLGEDRTVLGARLHDAFGAHGADTLFADASLGWRFAPLWHLGAAWRQGYTWARAGGMVAPGSRLASNGWAIDVERRSLIAPGDSLALRVSQPLRVQSGGIDLDLPIAYSYDTLSATTGIQRLTLAPRGREIDTELAWRGPLWNGSCSASLYYRSQPGHYAGLAADKGVAFSWRTDF